MVERRAPLIRSIRVEESLWDGASRSRRDDWRITIVDLLDDAGLGQDAHRELHVAIEHSAVMLRFMRENGAIDTHKVPSESLGALIGEYLHVIGRMQEEDVAESSSKMHALDMAKKVVHDKGAKVLASAAPAVAHSHETYRRLFTLVLSLLVDVTALPGAAKHRRHVLR